MNRKKTLMAVSVVLSGSLVSGTAQSAVSGQEGFNACVDALVSSLATAQGHPLQATISEDTAVSNRPLDRRTRIYLDARDPVSREIVAKADCIVGKNGDVLDLEHLPDDAPEAELRSL